MEVTRAFDGCYTSAGGFRRDLHTYTYIVFCCIRGWPALLCNRCKGSRTDSRGRPRFESALVNDRWIVSEFILQAYKRLLLGARAHGALHNYVGVNRPYRRWSPSSYRLVKSVKNFPE